MIGFPLLGGDPGATLRELRGRRVNFHPEEVEPRRWHLDEHRCFLARERPGPPVRGGAWEVACGLVRDYEFSDPGLVRACYDRRADLLGRDMLLEGRFHGLRFTMGVRVTDVLERTGSSGRHGWGWAYETLEGHLERGRMSYEVVKDVGSGSVEFVITGCSQRTPALGPVLRFGWLLFGRHTQLRFYRRCGPRLRALVRARLAGAVLPPPLRRGDLVLAPSEARFGFRDRAALRNHHPAGPNPRRG
ncbi:DUF1990 family protein [Saccharopolyspora cebuensis]|uniref:DUF1990 family protein n=1 Tax=Saccharopolyspora cebuensis TaxID=418759 RepID=A0ABV4CAT1_9PSEU